MKLIKQTTMRFSFEVRTDNDRALLTALAVLWFVRNITREVRTDLRETLTNVKKVSQIVFVSLAFGLGYDL